MVELIVVGMRFQPAYAAAKITIGDKLKLVLEPENKVNKDAIAVHIVDPDTGGSKGRVGYVRDADLNKIKRSDFSCFTQKGIYEYSAYYEVTRIATNYLRINSYNAGRPVNPCSEIYLRDLYAEDPYYATWGNVSGSSNTEQTTKPKEEKKMINTNAMRDSFFKEVKNVALDMQSGKLGVITKEGIVVCTDDGVSINPITEMGFTIPAFAMRVPVENLAKGDIIITSGEPVFFKEGSKAGYLTTSTSGVYQETGIVSNMFFGKNTVMAVKNMFGDSNGEAGGMNPMMLMAMMGDKDSTSGGFDFKKMMMFQMLGNMGGNAGANGMNPMMMAMLFSDKL